MTGSNLKEVSKLQFSLQVLNLGVQLSFQNLKIASCFKLLKFTTIITKTVNFKKLKIKITLATSFTAIFYFSLGCIPLTHVQPSLQKKKQILPTGMKVYPY